MQHSARMSKTDKKESNREQKSKSPSITIQEVMRTRGDKTWITYLVQGWRENGKWMRKQFPELKKAETFKALKTIELENEGRNQRMILSKLTEDQEQQAVAAFDALGETYSLKQAIDFFLKNHRPPEYVTTITDAMAHFLDDKERDGLKGKTLRGMKGVLNAFAESTGNPHIHAVTQQMVEKYLRGLRAVDGISIAKRKSWNTHRNDLSQFFAWSMTPDLATNRPWCFSNPVEGVRQYSARQVAEQRPAKATTTAEDLQTMFSVLMRYRGGAYVKVFALSYFAGIRPDVKDGEILKLAKREKELINLKTGQIFIPAAISKTKADRQVHISKNLRAWLVAYAKFPIVIPTSGNFSEIHSKIRTHFGLKRDETRHSFISYHVAVHRSIGDAALQAGNSESMVRKHYLNLHTKEEGQSFFSLVPDMKTRRAIFDETAIPEIQNLLRAI